MPSVPRLSEGRQAQRDGAVCCKAIPCPAPATIIPAKGAVTSEACCEPGHGEDPWDTHLVRQLEEPAARDVHVVVRPVAMVIGWLAASGAASTRLWAMHRGQAPPRRLHSARAMGQGPDTEQARQEMTRQPPGLRFPPQPPNKCRATKGRAASPSPRTSGPQGPRWKAAPWV